LLQIIGHIFVVDRGYLNLTVAMFGAYPLNQGLRNLASRNEKHHSIVWLETYFGILNRLDVDLECDGQTDRLAE